MSSGRKLNLVSREGVIADAGAFGDIGVGGMGENKEDTSCTGSCRKNRCSWSRMRPKSLAGACCRFDISSKLNR